MDRITALDTPRRVNGCDPARQVLYGDVVEAGGSNPLTQSMLVWKFSDAFR